MGEDNSWPKTAVRYGKDVRDVRMQGRIVVWLPLVTYTYVVELPFVQVLVHYLRLCGVLFRSAAGRASMDKDRARHALIAQ